MTSPLHWGKHFWYTLHITSLAFPDEPTEEQKEVYRQFYQKFGKILPCKKCAVNYELHLSELPIDAALRNSRSLFNWTVDLHNTVNRSLGKPLWPMDRAWEYYMNGAYDQGLVTSCINTASRTILILMIVINMIVIFYTLSLWRRL